MKAIATSFNTFHNDGLVPKITIGYSFKNTVYRQGKYPGKVISEDGLNIAPFTISLDELYSFLEVFSDYLQDEKGNKINEYTGYGNNIKG